MKFSNLFGGMKQFIIS